MLRIGTAPSPANLPKPTATNIHCFSLRYPAGYTAKAIGTEASDIYSVHLQKSSDAYIQITITPAPDEGSTVTVGSLRADYPYIADRLTEPFRLPAGVIGLAIYADATDHSPDNIWFQNGGYLYQFTAYGPAIQKLPAIVRSVEFM